MKYLNESKINSSYYVNGRIEYATKNLLKYIKNLPEDQQEDYKQKVSNIIDKEIMSVQDVIDFFENYDVLIHEMQKILEQKWLKLDFKKYVGYLKESIEFLVSHYDTKEDEENFKYLLEYVNHSSNMERLKEILDFYNSIVHKYNKLEITSIEDYLNKKKPPRFLVYSTGGAKILKDNQNYRKQEISVSYVMEEQFGTYASQYGSIGFIYPYEDVISAYPEDIYSWIDNDGEEKDPLKVDDEFILRSLQSYHFVFPLKLIIEKNKELSKKMTGHILDDSIYNELLIKDTVQPIGIYIMDYGLKDACHGYKKAKEMAESWNLPLVEIDKSIYRVQAGLDAFSLTDKYNIILSMIDQVCEENAVWAYYRDWCRIGFDHFVDEGKSDYFLDEVWKIYLKLKETNQISVANIKTELNRLMGFLSEQDVVNLLKDARQESMKK